MPDENEAQEGYEIVQKVNPVRLIQANLEGINASTHPAQAALHVAKLFLHLKAIRSLDEDFHAIWKAILGGSFMEHAATDSLRLRLSWSDVWRAQEALQDLMERAGMSFQAQLQDPFAQREAQLHARLYGVNS